jgi:hypothetical protein
MSALLFLAAACSHACSKPASDHYYFEPDSVRIERSIRVVTYDSNGELLSSYRDHVSRRDASVFKARWLSDPKITLQAFSIIGEEACTIHMIDPKVRYEPEFFGHEITHCLYGNFHPSQNKGRKG